MYFILSSLFSPNNICIVILTATAKFTTGTSKVNLATCGAQCGQSFIAIICDQTNCICLYSLSMSPFTETPSAPPVPFKLRRKERQHSKAGLPAGPLDCKRFHTASTEVVECSKSVTCILTQLHRVSAQSMICGGQVNRSLTFTPVEDEWCHGKGGKVSIQRVIAGGKWRKTESACLLHHRSPFFRLRRIYFEKQTTKRNSKSALINCQTEASLSLQVNTEVTWDN